MKPKPEIKEIDKAGRQRTTVRMNPLEATRSTIMVRIIGPQGSGKSVLARAIAEAFVRLRDPNYMHIDADHLVVIEKTAEVAP